MFARVTFPLSSFQTFTYAIPPELAADIREGSCVRTPFRTGERVGYVVQVTREAGYSGGIKSISDLHESDLTISQELWKTLEWVSQYYMSPLGMVLKAAIPQSFLEKHNPRLELYARITAEGIRAIPEIGKRAAARKRLLEALAAVDEPVKVASLSNISSSASGICRAMAEKEWVTLIQQPKVYDPFEMMAPVPSREITLNEEQQGVYKTMVRDGLTCRFRPWLLKGVTGSGKTEVYLKLAQDTVQENKGVLVLVPEIALTPQVARRFRNAFGDRVALWHSRMTRAEKGWTWQQLKSGKYSVVVGARSAVFTPLQNLGLIIVDEEQESSYKQENPAPYYHARDVALVRAKNAGAAILLTSATPGLESYYNSLHGKIAQLRLEQRYGDAVYPEVKLVNMNLEHKETGDFKQLFSRDLLKEIEVRLDRKEQIILLQNRRGYAVIQHCFGCGNVIQCPHCAVAMTYHRVGNKLLCHYCQHETPVQVQCDECGSDELGFMGSGTQKIEDELEKLLPNARIARMDVDTTRGKGGHYQILEAFGAHEADILLGTQMIAKGLDFRNVTLVGIINADSGLFLPDFRAGERVFQLIYQVAGRAGRHEKKGLAVIQTYNPEDPYIQSAARLDTKTFYNIALAQRNELFYPPFSRITRLLFTGPDRNAVTLAAEKMKTRLASNTELQVLGPVAAPIERIAAKWRSHIIVKSPRNRPGILHRVLKNQLTTDVFHRSGSKVRLQIDVDPVSML